MSEKIGKSDQIRARLEAAFAPRELRIINESEKHRGHAGYSDGESHFRVVIRAGALAGMSRIERHRAVHKALGPELVASIHALALEISA